MAEVEEINEHAFENSETDSENISGIYRWVDKIYTAQVYNYGLRLMFEFIVPEPAAFYIYSQTVRDKQFGIPIEEPQKPVVSPNIPLLHTHLTRDNYQIYEQMYGVQGIKPPPPEVVSASTVINQAPSGEATEYTIKNTELKIPEGYRATNITITASKLQGGGRGEGHLIRPPNRLHVLVAGRLIKMMDWTGTSGVNNDSQNFGIDSAQFDDPNYRDTIPIGVSVENMFQFVINVDALCNITHEKAESWQIETYNAIISAYQVLKSKYDDAVVENSINQGVLIAGKILVLIDKLNKKS